MNEDALEELVALRESGKLDEAAERLRCILKSNPDQLEATYLLGRIEMDRSDLTAAVPLLRHAAELAPEWPEAHANLGAALFLLQQIEKAALHLRRAAELDPRDAEAWNNLGVVLLANGRATEAEDAYLTALDLAPDYPEAVFNLGCSLSSLGRYREASGRFEQALRLDPDNPDVLLALGETCLAHGDCAESERAFERALELRPDETRAADGLRASTEARERAGSLRRHVREGSRLLEAGENEAAEAAFREALLISPDDDDALRGLATALSRPRRPEAPPIIERLIERSARDPQLLNSHGAALRDLSEARRANVQFRRALEVEPSHPRALPNLLRKLSDLGDAGEAEMLCRRALEQWPDRAELHNALGVALWKQLNYKAAADAFEAALRIDPQDALAMTNLGRVLISLGHELRSVRFLRRALAIDPSLADAWNSLAVIYLAWGKRDMAEELVCRAIALRPDIPYPHYTRALVLLTRREYLNGFKEYEHRLDMPLFAGPQTQAPKWSGEPNPRGVLMVYSEQGYGDCIHFSRYLAAARRRWQGKVVYYCFPELFALFEASDLPVRLVSRPREAPHPREGYDAYISLMSLPYIFGTVADAIPADIPYLRCPKDRAERGRERLDLGPELNVGLVWTGSSIRNCTLSMLAPLAGVPGVRLFSLQTGPAAKQLDDPPEGLEIVNLGNDVADFADTAAVIERLDLLISIDTASAHLAGALGRPTWILLPFASDWRWMIDRADSPWYPTVRLFRQPCHNAWGPVWERVSEELRAMVERRGDERRSVLWKPIA